MPRPSSTFLLAALVALATTTAWAQSAGPDTASAAAPVAPPADTTTSPVFTPSAAEPPVIHLPPADDNHGDAPRIQSSELTDAVVSSMPKYDPAKPAAAKPADAAAEPDKPKNGIIRLPKYVVRSRKPSIFTDKDVMTDKAKADLAMKNWVVDPTGANAFVGGTERVLFQSYADQQYADAERASNISSLRSDASSAAAGGDQAESDFIKEQSDDTYMRHADPSDLIPTDRPDAATPR